MKIFRRGYVLVVFLLLLFNISGCMTAKTYVVGISMPTKTSERWLLDAKYTVEALEEKGYVAKIAFAEDVVGNQAAQIDNFIEDEVDLLIVAPIDSAPLSEVLQRAEDQGIPVIAYDRLIMDMDHVDYYISFDNYKVGELQAQYIVDYLDFAESEKTIELFAGSQDDNNAELLFEGAMSVLRPYIESGDLIVKSEQYDIEEAYILRWDKMIAKSRMTGLLNLYYQDVRIDAVLSPFDGISAGIIEALQEAGYNQIDMPVISGQDAEHLAVKNIIKGKQKMTVFKDVRELGKAAAEVASHMLEGEKVEEHVKMYNGKTQVSAYFLEPVVVDKDNWEEVLVESGYYTYEELVD